MKTILPTLIAMLAGGAAQAQDDPTTQLAEVAAGLANLDAQLSASAAGLGITYEPMSPIMLPLIADVMAADDGVPGHKFDVAYNYDAQGTANVTAEELWLIFPNEAACAAAYPDRRVIAFRSLTFGGGTGHSCMTVGPSAADELEWTFQSDATVRTHDRQIKADSLGVASASAAGGAQAGIDSRTPALATAAAAFEDRVFATFVVDAPEAAQ